MVTTSYSPVITSKAQKQQALSSPNFGSLPSISAWAILDSASTFASIWIGLKVDVGFATFSLLLKNRDGRRAAVLCGGVGMGTSEGPELPVSYAGSLGPFDQIIDQLPGGTSPLAYGPAGNASMSPNELFGNWLTMAEIYAGAGVSGSASLLMFSKHPLGLSVKGVEGAISPSVTAYGFMYGADWMSTIAAGKDVISFKSTVLLVAGAKN